MGSRRPGTPRLAAAEAARLRAMLAAIPLSDEPFGGAKTTEPATLVALVYYHGLWERSWEAWQAGEIASPLPYDHAYHSSGGEYIALGSPASLVARLMALTEAER